MEQNFETPIQLSLPLTPWAQLVAPILVARTSARRALPIAQEFFRRWPTSAEYVNCRCSGGREAIFLVYLDNFFRPLGLAAVRVATVDRVAENLRILEREIPYRVPSRMEIMAIPGCGRYVADSFDLFYRGDFSIEPADPILASYAADRRRRFAEAEKIRGRGLVGSGSMGTMQCFECDEEGSR